MSITEATLENLNKVAVAGVDTLVGETLLDKLGELHMPSPLAIGYSDDAEPPMYRGRPLPLTTLSALDLSAIEVLLVLPGLPDSELVSRAEDAGIRLLDCADILAQRDDCLLVGADLPGEAGSLSWAIADVVSHNVALALAGVEGIARIDLSVVLPVSVAGRPGLETLAAETARMLNGQPPPASSFSQPLAFNVAVDASAAEIEQNLSRLLTVGNFAPQVNCLASMASAFHAHLCQVRVETDQSVDLPSLRERWAGNSLLDYLPGEAPSAVALADSERIQVGALFADRRNPNAFRFALSGDYLRHGVVNTCISLLQFLIKNAS
ncbi:hypothetical protein I6N98_10225 [Spongiibacter nanhainus]|uniref:Semialdehyde dehydrogenase dimerisation domain-containing protein n=1 Tax=Spongiibacter nanhainus TaxID=2794344 RepID=A0A7T4QXZ7_9GAMM|nr:Asd/ArgC dimerization domain-containing protein [Spongiibacter nanhainus]QQD16771.1 hypothetical protein I6N98_10225 [Spongiibacter nanhainus]